MGSNSAKGSLHSETSLPCKQKKKKMMFPTHRPGSMNTPYICLYSHTNAHTFSHIHTKYEHHYCTRWHTETPRSIKVVQTKAQRHTWVRWPRVQRRIQRSIHSEMTDLLIRHCWACFTFKMLLVQSWHHWWATRFEALKMLSNPCRVFYGNSKCTLTSDLKP